MSDDRYRDGGSESAVTGGPLDTAQAPVTPPIDVVFDLLADEQRRAVCLYLRGRDEAVATVDDIVDGIAGDRSEDERERLALELHHCHLPKLATAGMVDYDPRSNTARYWGQPTVEKWAEHVDVVTDDAETVAD